MGMDWNFERRFKQRAAIDRRALLTREAVRETGHRLDDRVRRKGRQTVKTAERTPWEWLLWRVLIGLMLRRGRGFNEIGQAGEGLALAGAGELNQLGEVGGVEVGVRAERSGGVIESGEEAEVGMEVEGAFDDLKVLEKGSLLEPFGEDAGRGPVLWIWAGGAFGEGAKKFALGGGGSGDSWHKFLLCK